VDPVPRSPPWFATTRATTATKAAAATAATGPATPTGGFGPRFVDHQPASTEFGIVQFLNGGLGLGVRTHLHERKSPRASGHLVGDDVNRFNGSNTAEEVVQFSFPDLERQIAYVQFSTHEFSPFERALGAVSGGRY
jgi:hypothetical protein